MSGLKAELFLEVDGDFVPQQLAQDPNPRPDGVWRWAGFDDILSGSGSWFLLNDTATVQHGRWCEALKSPEGLTMFGHWGDPGGVQVRLIPF